MGQRGSKRETGFRWPGNHFQVGALVLATDGVQIRATIFAHIAGRCPCQSLPGGALVMEPRNVASRSAREDGMFRSGLVCKAGLKSSRSVRSDGIKASQRAVFIAAMQPSKGGAPGDYCGTLEEPRQASLRYLAGLPTDALALGNTLNLHRYSPATILPLLHSGRPANLEPERDYAGTSRAGNRVIYRLFWIHGYH